ncbi:MAG: putative lipopolysaccharide heptosyltransferase III [Thermodesulfobacteriota bacterium]
MTNFSDVKKILVIKLRNIGDVLLIVPAIRALKETFPLARISVLVNPGTAPMLTGNPLVDEVIVQERGSEKGKLAEKVRGGLGFMKSLRAKGFDMTVDLTGGDRGALTGFAAGARYRLGPHPGGKGFKGKKYFYTHIAPSPPAMTHTVLRNLSILQCFGIDTKNLTVDFFTTEEDEAAVSAVLKQEGLVGDGKKPFVHVHPVSRWLFKCPPAGFLASLLDHISAEGMPVVMTSGPDERELALVREIARLMQQDVHNLSGVLSLKGLGALSARSAFFFGVDSAPMHIAAASGVPVVGLFGPSGAFDWGPWDNEASGKLSFKSSDSPCTPYPRRNGVQRFGANTVIQDTRECVPCGKDGCDGSKKSDCLYELDEALVKNILTQYIIKYGTTEIQREGRV